ncbi:MAG: beta-galactosidase trimerization domain-containing protein [Terriglobia bacterium]
MKRRAFLETTAAGLGALASHTDPILGNRAAARQARDPADLKDLIVPPDGYEPPDWFRYAYAVYFEGYAAPLFPSIKRFNARQLVDVVVKLGGNMLRFQPIGFWAYYPSKYFPVFPELGNRDLIHEVSPLCRNANVHIYCYTGYGSPFMDRAVVRNPKYADLALRDADGKPYGLWNEYGEPPVYYLCIQGDAYRAMIRGVVRELCEHDTDGVYFDAPSGYRKICFCDSCRRSFKQFTGSSLDVLRDVRDLNRLPANVDMDALAAWYRWANELVKEDLLDFRKIIHGSGKFMMCHNGDTWTAGALFEQYRVPDGFMVEWSEQVYQRLYLAMLGASMARPTRKLAQMYMGSYDVQAIGQPPDCKPWSAHTQDLEDGDEILMDGFTNLAGGNMPIYAVANRLLFGLGDGSARPAQDVFAFIRRIEPLQKDSVPVPYVAVVPSWASLGLWRARRKSWNVAMGESFLLTMLDSRISCDVNSSTEMSDAWLKEQRVIAVCGASVIRDQDAQRLAEWVRAGGGLIATYDSGLYDECGEPRTDGGALKELLGVEMKTEPLRGVANAYYRLKRTHPALAPYKEGALVMGDPRLVRVELREGATLLADDWSFDSETSRGPAIVLNRYGKGQAIYVSGSLEINYTSSRVLSLRRLLSSMVRYLAGDRPLPFHLKAPRGVYGVLRRAPNGDVMLWILANVGFKDDALGTTMRQEYVPVSNLEAEVLVPEGRKVTSVELLRSQQKAPFSMQGNYARITLPSVHVAEVVHVALSTLTPAGQSS